MDLEILSLYSSKTALSSSDESRSYSRNDEIIRTWKVSSHGNGRDKNLDKLFVRFHPSFPGLAIQA
jgi:hypothetical protein